MTYPFKNPDLERLFVRQQRTQPSDAIEDAWQTTSKWSYALFEKSGELFASAGLYLVIAIAIAIEGGRALESQAAQVVFSAAVLGVFVEIVRRIYDTAARRIAIIDLFTSEMFNI